MRKTWPKLLAQKGQTPIVISTAYDATSARLMDPYVDALLVGDSLGMVVAGQENTLGVGLDQMVYHCSMVARGSSQACLIGDLPFLSYQISPEQALASAGRLVVEGGVQAVKLEGGKAYVLQIVKIVEAGIPVVGHLGMMPQRVHEYGGYGKQAKGTTQAQALMEEALAVQEAGISLLVLENIPHQLAAEVTEALDIPTIGIGAGSKTDGQVQVWHDLIGLDPDFSPRHAVRFRELGREVQAAASEYAEAVRSGQFDSK